MQAAQKSPLHLSLGMLCSILIILSWTGCTADEEVVPVFEEEVGEALYFERIGLGHTALFTERTERVVRTPEAWAVAQDSLIELGPFKDVDFEQTMVLFAAVPVETGGYSIQFETIELVNDEIIATYMLTEPDEDCIPTTTLTQAMPFQAVLVRRADAPVRFVQETELFTCELE